MRLRQKEYYCPRCNERRLFIELEPIYSKTNALYLWAHSTAEETGAINPYFICKCGYAEKLEYLEYPERKPPPSFLKKKWSAFVARIKGNWEDRKRLK